MSRTFHPADTSHNLESPHDAFRDSHLAGHWRAPSQGTLVERVRSEFAEMPGMRLTVAQVQRLCGVDRIVCAAILDSLVESGCLCRQADGTYAQVTNESRAATGV
jgi:hypothetical protein